MNNAIDIRIYYEDTDAGGIVYHASYLRFAERGRTEFLRALGWQNSDLEKEFGTLFVVRHIDIEYLKPAFLDDLLSLETSVKSIRNTSFIMNQTVSRAGESIAQMKVALVCIGADTLKPVRLPSLIKSRFEQFLLK
jgi:acyl-CoA thioester hydrolase